MITTTGAACWQVRDARGVFLPGIDGEDCDQHFAELAAAVRWMEDQIRAEAHRIEEEAIYGEDHARWCFALPLRPHRLASRCAQMHCGACGAPAGDPDADPDTAIHFTGTADALAWADDQRWHYAPDTGAITCPACQAERRWPRVRQ